MHFLTLASIGTPGALLMIFLEYLGIPLPTELSYFVFRIHVLHGAYNWYVGIALLMLAHIFGSLTAYSIGRRVGHAGNRKKLTGIQLRVHKWYEKHGGLLVYGAQLIGHVRPWSSYVAGYAGMPRREFLVYSVSGAATLTAIMLLFADLITRIWKNSFVLRIVVNGLGGVVITLSIIAILRQAHRIYAEWEEKSSQN
jgi:membrane protein DedA with SNARE-associated domain